MALSFRLFGGLIVTIASGLAPPAGGGDAWVHFVGFNGTCDGAGERRPAHLYAGVFDTDSQSWMISAPSALTLGSGDVCTYSSRTAVDRTSGRLFVTFSDCYATPFKRMTAAWDTRESGAPRFSGVCMYNPTDAPSGLFFDARVYADGPFFIRSDGVIVGLTSPTAVDGTVPPCVVKELVRLAPEAVAVLGNADPMGPGLISTDDGDDATLPPLVVILGPEGPGSKFNVTGISPVHGSVMWQATWTCGAPIAYVCPEYWTLLRVWNRRMVAVGMNSRSPSTPMGFHGWANASSQALYWVTPNFPAEPQSGGAMWMDPIPLDAEQPAWPLYLSQVTTGGDNSACHDTTTSSNATVNLVEFDSDSEFGIIKSVPMARCPLPHPSACTISIFSHGRPDLG